MQNAMTGRVGDPIETPTSFGEKIFKKKNTRLRKLVSGAHHTLALTVDGKVWAWGDAECGKIGRILRTRDKNQSALRIESVGAKDAVDVFCGAHTSFYKNKKNQLFAWGLNNHGQLGIGHKENTCNPTLVEFSENTLNVTSVEGGEHHTVCCTDQGVVFCWGRNDESQCGLGDLFDPYKREEQIKKA